MMKLEDIISVNPDIQGGRPVFKGTRVRVETLFDYLETSSLEDFLEGFPGVSRMQAEAALETAGQLLTSLNAYHEDSIG